MTKYENFQKILDRLKNFFNVKFDGDVGKLMGMKPALVNHYLTKNQLPVKQLMALSEEYRLSLDWLFTGKGEPKLQDKDNFLYFYKLFGNIFKLLHSRYPELDEQEFVEAVTKIKEALDFGEDVTTSFIDNLSKNWNS